MDWIQDVRFALRGFGKNPGFALVIVLTLGLGIGANTAIFSIADQLLLRLLPVEDPEELVVLDGPGPFSGTSHSNNVTITPLSHPMFERIRDENDVFDGVLAEYRTPVHFSASDSPERVTAALVSGGFFDVLGVSPRVGRLFNEDDDRDPGGHPLVVLGHALWESRFGSDPGIVGEAVRVNEHPMTVIGVAPRGFRGIEVGQTVDVYVPLSMQAEVIPTWTRGLADFRTRWLTVMARLEDGRSLASAEAGINVLYRSLLIEDLASVETSSEAFRARFLEKHLNLHPGGRGTSGLRTQSRTPVLVLSGMVGLVLLIACANIANLLLVRASSQKREIALKLAVGASRSHLIRQLLAESLLLSILGGFLGLLLASWTSEALLHGFPSQEELRFLSTELDLRLGMFALGLSLFTGLLFGTFPALQFTRTALASTLKAEAGAVIGASGPSRFRRGLVVAQVSLSLLLLVGCGLFARSLMNLSSLDPGFEPERLIVFSVDPALNGYEPKARMDVVHRIRDEVASVPGVNSVSMSEIPLLDDSTWRSTVRVDQYEPEEGEDMNPYTDSVGPGHFGTLGIPLLAGRDFTEGDALESPKVAIVNENFARYFFDEDSAIGRRFGFGRQSDLDVEIVGVVRDGKTSTLRDEPRRFIYLPLRQNPQPGQVTFYLRSSIDEASLLSQVRPVVRRVDPNLPVTELKTMSDQIGESLFVERLLATLSIAFAVLATLLAAFGLYGLMSYAVALRTREIGIRVALGAARRQLVGMVVREVAVLIAIGVGVGLPAGYVLARAVEAELFGLTALDPVAFATSVIAIVSVALAAAYVPASRASRVSPIVALRHD